MHNKDNDSDDNNKIQQNTIIIMVMLQMLDMSYGIE
jgi:hypothetical protein